MIRALTVNVIVNMEGELPRHSDIASDVNSADGGGQRPSQVLIVDVVTTIVSSHSIVGGPTSPEGSPANTGVSVVEERKGPSVVCGKHYLKCVPLLKDKKRKHNLH